MLSRSWRTRKSSMHDCAKCWGSAVLAADFTEVAPPPANEENVQAEPWEDPTDTGKQVEYALSWPAGEHDTDYQANEGAAAMLRSMADVAAAP